MRNMDAFKFAFETTIVGLLALPWLALFMSIFVPIHPVQFPEERFLSKILQPAVLSIVGLAVAYFLGSAITPLATQLLDDPDLPKIKKIQQIRSDLYLWYFDWLSATPSPDESSQAFALSRTELLRTLPRPDPTANVRRSPEQSWKAADKLFLLQEQSVLREGTDKTERVSRLHEQVIVLRGAVFNGFVFCVLSLFANLARKRGEPLSVLVSNPVVLLKTLAAVLLSAGLAFTAVDLGKVDLLSHDVTDPPIMEAGLLALGLVGFYTVWKGVRKLSYAPAALAIGLVFSA